MEAILVTAGTSKAFFHLLLIPLVKAMGLHKGAHGVIKEGIKEVVKDQAKEAIQNRDNEDKDDKKEDEQEQP